MMIRLGLPNFLESWIYFNSILGYWKSEMFREYFAQDIILI